MTPQELRNFGLHHPLLRWKPVFTSSTDRMGRFLNAASRSLELFYRKLIVLRVDERLSLILYIPQKISKANEVRVDSSVRVFALPRSSGVASVKYRVVPTKVDYRIYCDDNVFQLYQANRRNTFVFLTAGPLDESSFRHIDSEGDRRRQKQATIQNGTNYECRASVALDKISKAIQTHVGRLNRAGLLAAVGKS
jgi:regulator of nonsense transcripts 1